MAASTTLALSLILAVDILPEARAAPSPPAPTPGFDLRAVVDRPSRGPENWSEQLELRVRTAEPLVADLRASRPDEVEYATALTQLLVRTGLFPDGVPESRSHAPVEMTIERGLATIKLDAARLRVSEDEPGPCYRFHLSKVQGAGRVELVLHDHRVESAEPLPELDDGQGRLIWKLPRKGVEELTACVAPIDLELGWKQAVQNRAGWWGMIGPLAAYYPLLLVFLLAGMAFGQAKPEAGAADVPVDAGRMLTRAAVLITVALVIVWWLLVVSYVLSEREGGRARTVAFEVAMAAAVALPAAVLAGVVAMTGVVVAASSRSRVLAFAFAALALVGALVIGEAATFDPLLIDGSPEALTITASVVAVLIVLVLPLLALTAATRLALAAWRQRLGFIAGSRRDRVARIAVVAVGAALALHGIASAYLFHTRINEGASVTEALTQVLPHQPFSLLSASLTLLELTLFAVLLACLHSAANDKGLLPTLQRPWLAIPLGLVFAVYVVGLGGRVDVLAIPLPLPFLIALLAILILILRRKRAGAPATPSGEAEKAPTPTAPEEDWWENGLRSARAARLLAIPPILFYGYFLLDARLGEALEFRLGFGPLHLALSLIFEAIFWLAAALSLGWLYGYLPGGYGVLKAVTLAVIYVASLGISDFFLALPQDWIFRGFALTLFLVLLGMRLDLHTLALRGDGWRQLPAVYQLGTVRGVIGYLTPTAVALFGIGQQLYTGEADDALRQIFGALPDLLPSGNPEDANGS